MYNLLIYCKIKEVHRTKGKKWGSKRWSDILQENWKLPVIRIRQDLSGIKQRHNIRSKIK